MVWGKIVNIFKRCISCSRLYEKRRAMNKNDFRKQRHKLLDIIDRRMSLRCLQGKFQKQYILITYICYNLSVNYRRQVSI